MLEIKNIKKEYHTDAVVSKALNSVSVSFRDNEFVSVLGPSGSGKTTLLNIIGGLDSYDTGDLIINGVSTKEYKDRQWDTYRNYTVGFVFQSYNLIPHQSVLGNVELALTIGGYTKKQSKKKAVEALNKVGLKEHIYKKPNQLSGGQMQRVAIARALVNDPDILLADEPTGALDSETSVQIMNLLKKVAKDRLVVMVTHNPDLAQEYSTRIIKLKDGEIINDSNPFDVDKYEGEISQLNYLKKSKMTGMTCLGLSFKNLLTKKRRTLLTAFAGSIGIIGISLILSLSTGVNQYIDDIQSDTMASYPIIIDSETIAINTLMNIENNNSLKQNNSSEVGIYADLTKMQVTTSMVAKNNLTEFKKYLEDEVNNIDEYLGKNGIMYSYNPKYDTFTFDEENKLINTSEDTSKIIDDKETSFSVNGNMINAMQPTTTEGNFTEILKDENSLINDVVKESYSVISGQWPDKYDEVMLFVNSNKTLDIDKLYQLGFITKEEYKDIYNKLDNDENLSEGIHFNYDDFLNKEYHILTSNERYIKDKNGDFEYLDDEYYTLNQEKLKEGITVKIVGIAILNDDVDMPVVNSSIGYTAKLTEKIINLSNESNVVKAQKENIEKNVLTGLNFEALNDEEKINTTKKYISNLDISDKASMYMTIMYLSSNGAGNTSMMVMPDEKVLATMMDNWLANTPDDKVLISVYESTISGATYDENMEKFGVINYDSPKSISIYTDSFENKEAIANKIQEYNSSVSEENKITYTDFVALLTNSLTTIIDVISYVLIAFVSVSLFVSCIMIGIITHISVMERTKEIGVLRALGASKKNISQVFNAETLLIGLCSGIIGVGATIFMNIPITNIIRELVDNDMISVKLPFVSVVILVVLSVIITIIGGLLPAKNAAKKDPVIALRTE